MPRSKFAVQKSKYLDYQRSRKKPHKKKMKRIRSLLHLLEKLLGQIKQLVSELGDQLTFPGRYYQRMQTIKQVLDQQRLLFEKGQRSKGMIVSIDKHYIRPIVRGKETKRVEFCCKFWIFKKAPDISYFCRIW